MTIETKRTNDSLRRRARSEKVHESAARTLNWSTPMGLSFEHTRAVGARTSEKAILRWWGSAEQLSLPMKEFRNHCANNELPPPKKHWIATSDDFEHIF